MTRQILAISPDTKLLQQITAHLQEGGRYQIFPAASGKEALTLAPQHSFQLVILDAETTDLPFVPLTRELFAVLPYTRLLVYPPQNNPHHPLMHGVSCDGFLNKPFFGPEVNEKINHALAEPRSTSASANIANDLLNNLENHPETGAEQIEQLLGSTNASAAMLLMHARVIAAAGALGSTASQNVVNFLTRYWNNIQSGELFRYLKMDSETRTYLVYAAPLIKNVAFALIYHQNISLLEIRNEVTQIRQSLLARYANTSQLRMEFDSAELPPAEPGNAPGTQKPTHTTKPLLPDEVSSTATEAEENGDEEGAGLDEQQLANLDNLLASMPTPDPDAPDEEPSPAIEPSGEWIKESTPPEEKLEGEPTLNEEAPLLPTQETSVSGEDQESSMPPVENEAANLPQTHPIPQRRGDKTAPLPHLDQPPAGPTESEYPDFNFSLPWENDNNEEGNPPASQTPPPITQPVPPLPPLEPDTYRVHLLILPLNPQQLITHDLSDLLKRQLPLLHASNGWQCLAISIRPLYMQWTAELPAHANLPDVVDEIKERSAIQIFAAFPSLLQAHLDGEFWANGYFSMDGDQVISAKVINDYIAQVRQFPPQSFTR